MVSNEGRRRTGRQGWPVRRAARLSCLAAVLLVLSTAGLGQSATTALRGLVADASGAQVRGVTVTADDAQLGIHQVSVTTDSGEYSFAALQPGSYVVHAAGAGFQPQSVAAELLVGRPQTVNFTLAPADQQVEVTVNADAVSLNTTDATLGEAVRGETVQVLPIEGRNVPDLLSLQPGVLYLGRQVNPDLDSRSGAVAGSRSDQGNITLDGVDNNAQVQGYAFTGVLRSTLDSVAEFRVTTTGANADTGRSSGAQVNILTRSGTNQPHGSVYEYNRNTALAANNWFNKQAQIAGGLPNRPGKLIRNTFGAALGGPIRRDRLFLFGNYEGQRTAENLQQTLTVPTASLRAGQLSYNTPDAAAASGVRAVTLTRSQVAAMDPRCSAAGTCPNGPGANPAVLALLSQYPLPNGNSAGDGLNTASFTWSAPNPAQLNTGIVRADAIVNDRQRVFVRGVLQDDTISGVPQLPGQAPGNRRRDNTKGIAAGYIWSPTQSLVNNLRYGFARQSYADRGIAQGAYVNFAPGSISTLTAQTRNSTLAVPVHNVLDDVTWTRGVHSLQAGVNYRLIHNQRASDALSYDSAGTIGFDVTQSGFAGTGQSFDPAAFGLPTVAPAFANSYNLAAGNLAGIISQVTNQYNYTVSRDGTTGALVPQGASIAHDFKANEWEYYLQDTWRARSNLTLTFGLRHTLAQTPYEVHGQQAQITTDVHQYFANRVLKAAAGVPDTTALSFAPSGQARGLRPYWPMQTTNLAPRLALAWAVDSKTAVRAGFGLFYDHFGQGIVNTFSQYGSYGLQGQKQTPNDALSPDNAPRFTSAHAIPPVNGPTPAAVSYPFTPSTDPFSTGFATAVGLDDHLKTPYSYTLDLSVERELPSGFTVEVAYVGRLGRHLLQQTDLAAPANFADPASGQDFYSAATVLTKAYYAGAKSVAPVPYFEHLFPDAANGGVDGSGKPGASATQNIYANLVSNYPVNASFVQYSLDVLCSPGCGGTHGRYYNPQFNSLFSWTSNGTSSYNAAQIVLRHPASRGLTTDVSYTFSKSLDFGSDTERTCLQCGGNGASDFSWIVNAFNPSGNYGVSDFDTRHLLTADWVYDLPFGRGRRFGSRATRLTEAALGGWQLTGLARWTSGLPFSIFAGNGWEVDWSQESAVVKTGKVKTRRHLDANGTPQVFDRPDAVIGSLPTGNLIRNPLPGESGSRNAFRGDGYFDVDAGLAKSIRIHEEQALRLSWEVFNVTNSVRFDVNPITSLQNQTTSGAFGAYGAVLTQPRVQQLSARYSF